MIQRRRLTVNGIVQGVGFRPFVYRLAKRLSLTGLVANTSLGVVIEVQGDGEGLDRFCRALEDEAPAPALVAELTALPIPLQAEHDFAITPSDPEGPAATLIAPDLAVCDACLAELFDPSNRRYRYPFINCTHCGPRFTIITGIPYDRPATTMAPFTMCPACLTEYDEPTDRRFHAQPNACPVCGPRVELRDNLGQPIPGEVFANTAALLAAGRIVAVKGLGGFHLAVDATNDAAIRRLRERKGRAAKPLAVMVPDLGLARQLAELTPDDEAILTSPQRPIVLAPKRDSALIGTAIAPGGLTDFGLMLPYTPVHHLLLHAFPRPLVMTSGNVSDEPICIANHEALAGLATVADAFLLHDREIVCRADDTVAISRPGPPRLLRRSRGYAPSPLLVRDTGPQVLAVGGELKGAICLLKDRYAFVSQHLGDLKNLAADGFFREAIAHLCRLFAGQPELVVHDLHPAYRSSQWACHDNRLPTLTVQHHHAHLVACLAENRHPGPAIGVILDGTGLGSDGTIWGGEVLIGDAAGCQRVAFFEPMPLPGGEAAIRHPWRTAVGYLTTVFAGNLPQLPFLVDHDWQPVAEIAGRGLNSPLTSSTGRLFDAIAAMAGGRQSISYEGQAAIELMAVAGPALGNRSYPVDLATSEAGTVMCLTPMLRAVVADIEAGRGLAEISRAFHRTLVELLHAAVCRAASASGLQTVALSGGVFANPLLQHGLSQALSRAGLTVLSHSQLPPGDGCLALGQAVIGRRHLQAAP